MFTQDNLCLQWARSYILKKYKESKIKKDVMATIFDIGFNRGEFLADAYSILGTEIEFYAFEPNKNVSNPNMENVHFFNVALGDVEGLATLFMPYNTKEKDLVSRYSSLYVRPVFHKMNDSILESMDVKITTVDKITLDCSVEHIDYLKIDTEGYELNVLKGAKDTFFSGKISAGQFEFGDCFKEQGYTLEDVVGLLQSYNCTCFLGPIEKKNIVSIETASRLIQERSNDLWENILFVNNRYLENI